MFDGALPGREEAIERLLRTGVIVPLRVDSLIRQALEKLGHQVNNLGANSQVCKPVDRPYSTKECGNWGCTLCS